MLLTSSFAIPLVLLSVAQGKLTGEDQGENVARLSAYFESFLPSPDIEPGETEVPNWNVTEKSAAAVAVSKLLLNKFNGPMEYAFHSLISGYKCTASFGEPHVILHLKFLRSGKREPETPKDFLAKENVYCTWTGTVDESLPNKTHGYICFQSHKLSREEEEQMVGKNPCANQKYSTDGFYRLSFPADLQQWKKEFLLYEPPVALPRDEKGPHGGKGLSEADKNPKGRTGIAGRGLLPNWGENELDILIIIRRENKTVDILMHEPDGTVNRAIPLPMFYKAPKDGTPQVITPERHFRVLLEPGLWAQCTEDRLRTSVQRATKLFRGYLSHPYTTDNAWVKGTIYIIRTKEEPCFDKLDLTKNTYYKWKTFSNSTLKDMKELIEHLFAKQQATEISTTARQLEFRYTGLVVFLMSAAGLALVICVAASLPAFYGVSVALFVLTGLIAKYILQKWTTLSRTV